MAVSAARSGDDRLRIFVPHASDTFTNALPHGDGLVAFEVASRLAARGHDLHVMSPKIDVRGTNVPPTLHLHPPARSGGRGLRGRLTYLPQVRATYARLKRERPFDLVHQLNPVFTGISLALADARVPVVLGAYVAAWPRDADSAAIMAATRLPFAGLARRGVAALQQRFAAALIISTPAAAAHVAERRHSYHKTFAIPHGIDPSRFSSAAAHDPAGWPTILFLGGTERRKGIYVLLDAFRIVHRARPDVRLAIAGAGGREGEVAAFVATMAERGNVDLLGAVGRADVPALMRRASVFAAPSFGEPFGMSLLEAMASGRPVVVTDAGGPAHIVTADGGLKVPVGDAPALGAALLTILDDAALASAMGRANRRTVEATYAWERVIDEIEAVYRHVLSRRARA